MHASMALDHARVWPCALTYTQVDLMGSWRGPTNVPRLLTERRREAGKFAKQLCPSHRRRWVLKIYTLRDVDGGHGKYQSFKTRRAGPSGPQFRLGKGHYLRRVAATIRRRRLVHRLGRIQLHIERGLEVLFCQFKPSEQIRCPKPSPDVEIIFTPRANIEWGLLFDHWCVRVCAHVCVCVVCMCPLLFRSLGL